MKVPFLDLKAHHTPLIGEINTAIAEVIESGAFAGGPFVDSFERDFAAFCESNYALGVGSGTEALWLSLLALGVGPGDEVITVPSTFLATAEAISYCGAKPVFVDIEERTYTMEYRALNKAISTKTRAIIPVHLYGQPADMAPILEIAAEHGLPVIEDACQAHGALYNGRKVGAIGVIGCFSFYPGKNLGAFGEAGAIVTNDINLYEKAKILRDHGQVRKYHHSMIGWNCRMDGIQAAVLRVKLQHLDRANEQRRRHAAFYSRALREIGSVITPYEAPYAHHVFHIYSIRVKNRDEVIRFLDGRGVSSGIHYPIPVHLQEAYHSLGYDSGAFPVSEECANEFVSLPMFPELSAEHLNAVVEAVTDLFTAGLVT